MTELGNNINMDDHENIPYWKDYKVRIFNSVYSIRRVSSLTLGRKVIDEFPNQIS